MAAKKSSKKSSAKKGSRASNAGKLGIGVGLTAAAVAAAGAYFLYGSPKASKNRSTVKSWALKAKGEVLEALEDAKEMNQKDYENLVEKVGSAYAMAQGASKGDLKMFKNEMHDHWGSLAKKFGAPTSAEDVMEKVVQAVSGKVKKKSSAPKKRAKTTKKATKKSAKRTAKKATKKKA